MSFAITHYADETTSFHDGEHTASLTSMLRLHTELDARLACLNSDVCDAEKASHSSLGSISQTVQSAQEARATSLLARVHPFLVPPGSQTRISLDSLSRVSSLSATDVLARIQACLRMGLDTKLLLSSETDARTVVA